MNKEYIVQNKITNGWRKVKSKYCQACLMEEASEVHHIVGRFDFGGNEEENLIDLCHECHIHAPNGIEEMKWYVQEGGYKGRIITKVVVAAFYSLLSQKIFKPFINEEKIMKKSWVLCSKLVNIVLKDIQKRGRMDVDDYRRMKKK